jgi:hypothetical protein
VPGARELLRGREARGARTDHSDGLAREPLGRMRLDPVVRPGLVDDRHLDLLDRHGRLVDAEHARALAGCRTQATSELREVVRGVQAFDGLASLAPARVVVPLRDEVAERAALVTERHTTVHAAASLTAERRGVALLVDLFPVHESQGDRPACGQLALPRLQESLGVSHRSPP